MSDTLQHTAFSGGSTAALKITSKPRYLSRYVFLHIGSAT